MKIEKTNRGFDIICFDDFYGEKCSLQKSSLATEDAIWFGVDNPKPKVLKQNEGWVEIPLPSDTLIASRMHLSQAQVKEILPYLVMFAETGEIDGEIP